MVGGKRNVIVGPVTWADNGIHPAEGKELRTCSDIGSAGIETPSLTSQEVRQALCRDVDRQTDDYVQMAIAVSIVAGGAVAPPGERQDKTMWWVVVRHRQT